MEKKIIQLVPASIPSYALLEKHGNVFYDEILMWALVEDSDQNRTIEGVTLAAIRDKNFVSDNPFFVHYTAVPPNSPPTPTV